MMKLRAKWSDYMVKECEKCTRSGEPVIRPMWWLGEHEDALISCDQFLVGESLLVAPVLQKDTFERTVFIPSGVAAVLKLCTSCSCFLSSRCTVTRMLLKEFFKKNLMCQKIIPLESYLCPIFDSRLKMTAVRTMDEYVFEAKIAELAEVFRHLGMRNRQKSSYRSAAH